MKRLDDHVAAEKVEEAMIALFESASQAPSDFCGAQREWHVPRLQKAMALLMEAFPSQAIRAMEKAKRHAETIR